MKTCDDGPAAQSRPPVPQQTEAMKKILLLTATLGAGAALTITAADGKAVYTKECAKCHGEDGKGQTRMGQRAGVKDYTVTDFDLEKAMKSLKDGMTDKDGKVIKRPMGDKLSDADIRASLEYLKAFKK
jgi:cytochrome c553